jgi:hypothetical protein
MISKKIILKRIILKPGDLENDTDYLQEEPR